MGWERILLVASLKPENTKDTKGHQVHGGSGFRLGDNSFLCETAPGLCAMPPMNVECTELVS